MAGDAAGLKSPGGRSAQSAVVPSNCQARGKWPSADGSAVWVPPPEYRNTDASKHGKYPEADLYPVPDRRGISMSNPRRPINQQAQQIRRVIVADFSLDKATPQLAAGNDAQIDCGNASNDFIKEKLHPSICSSSADSMTRPHRRKCGMSASWHSRPIQRQRRPKVERGKPHSRRATRGPDGSRAARSFPGVVVLYSRDPR